MVQQKHAMPMKSLLEAGVHFGHRTPRWNPKMRRYIFTQRNGIHIIDLQQTIKLVDDAYRLVVDTVANGGVVLFVGTKKQAQETISEEALRCEMPFVNQRWLGGTLTNWRTIRQRIDDLLNLEKQQVHGEFHRLVKKEALSKEKEIVRLNRRLGGLKTMSRLPNLLFLTDVRRETIAVKEANILGIPILAMVDTNCDPDPIDYVIPSNDDAIRAIRLITSKMADAVLEGQSIRQSEETEDQQADASSEADDISRYLGPSTLAKIRAATTQGEDDAPSRIYEPDADTDTEDEDDA
jgi:small subunit ribosomal protein S2